MADFGVLDAGAVSPVATLVPVWSVLGGATEVTDGDVTAEFVVVVVCPAQVPAQPVQRQRPQPARPQTQPTQRHSPAYGAQPS